MESIKLTLSVKSDSLPLVKKYAKRRHTSVSKLVQQFFDGIVAEEEASQENQVLEKFKNVVIADDIKALSGILKGKYPDDITLWDARYEYLKEKYDL